MQGNSRRRPQRFSTFIRVLGALATLILAPALRAQDAENCLSCHRFRGLSRLDSATGEIRLFFCDARSIAGEAGPHSRLRCTDCHEKTEVSVVPHQVRTPVDCTRTCHLASAGGAELKFSHAEAAESLAQSAHSAGALAKLTFNPALLRPGQANCLYCHEEPRFGFADGVPEMKDRRGVSRCDHCHKESLPVDTRYFAQHVAARLRPRRDARQQAQMCAVCHSDRAVLAQTGGTDAVASYFHSFHGKASLLGSKDTATCVDCHSGPQSNPHEILERKNAAAPISTAELPNTCRTTSCHPGSSPKMSSAAVHLELDSRRFPLEFGLAAGFILMTAGVLGAFILLIIFELLNAGLRRSDPEHEKLIRLAQLIQRHPDGRKQVQRMNVHQRWQHWGLVITFVALVYTGMPIKFADSAWASHLIDAVGGLSVARWIHRVAGVGLMAVFLYHIGYMTAQALRTQARERAAGRKIPLWRVAISHPLMLGPRDLKEAVELGSYLLGRRRHRPRFGRFNFTQKFEYWAVFWGVPVMGLSGLALWGMPAVTDWLTGRAMNFAYIVHSDEAYLAFIYIATVHLFGVILAPVVFPLSLGTLSGQAPALELAEAHRGELEEIAKRLGVVATTPPKSARRAALGRWLGNAARRLYSLSLMVAYGFLAYFSIHFLLGLLAGHQEPPAEIVDIPRRLEVAELVSLTTPTHESVNERPRGPLAHFHQIPQWFSPDPGNSCATVGCHGPLPHGKRVETRAFLNMHTTFVDCMVCHANEHAGATAGWLRLPSRTPIARPALLVLADYLAELPNPPIDPIKASTELRKLISAARPDVEDQDRFADWLLALETTNPGGKPFQGLVHEIREDIQTRTHGEYGAKIAWLSDNRPKSGLDDRQQAAASRVRSLGAAARFDADSSAKRDLDLVHRDVRPTGALCTPCHSSEPQLVDWNRLGYSAERVRGFENDPTIRSILSIESGQPFRLPIAGPTER